MKSSTLLAPGQPAEQPDDEQATAAAADASEWKFLSRSVIGGLGDADFGAFQLSRYKEAGVIRLTLGGPAAAMQPGPVPDVYEDLLELVAAAIEAHADVRAWRANLVAQAAVRAVLREAEREAALASDLARNNDLGAIRGSVLAVSVVRETKLRVQAVAAEGRELQARAEKVALTAWTTAAKQYQRSKLDQERDRLHKQLVASLGELLTRQLAEVLSVHAALDRLRRIHESPPTAARLLGAEAVQ